MWGGTNKRLYRLSVGKQRCIACPWANDAVSLVRGRTTKAQTTTGIPDEVTRPDK
jgi:hypothetical protein